MAPGSGRGARGPPPPRRCGARSRTVGRKAAQMPPQAGPLHVLHRRVINLEDAGPRGAGDTIGPRVQPGAQDDDGPHAVGQRVPQHVVQVGEATQEHAQHAGSPAFGEANRQLPKAPQRERREQGAEEGSAQGLGERVVEEALLGRDVTLDCSQYGGADGGPFGLERHTRALVIPAGRPRRRTREPDSAHCLGRLDGQAALPTQMGREASPHRPEPRQHRLHDRRR